MNRVKSRLLILSVILLWSLSLSVPGWAAEYPSKPITFILPYPAGGSTDLTTRALANAARKYLGQPIIIENKPGGGATVGPTLLLTKPPDGYTIGLITSGVTIAYHMGKLSFNPVEDVTHIMRWGGYLFGIMVRADAPWKTIQEFIQDSRQTPQKIIYTSVGVGTSPHLAMEELALAAGNIQWIHVPSKGGTEASTALLGGHVDASSGSSGLQLVDAGKFRLLATYSEHRSERYPQVPTLKEIGYPVISASPLGIIAPKGLPRPIADKLHDAFRKAMDDADFQAIMKKFDMSMLYLNTEDYEKFFRQDSEQIGRLVQKLGLQKK
jgi:tripartite-type tricarboxylate transporter receptor subunit TctC